MSERDSICASEEKPEEWKPLVGWEERYEVSSYGRIRSRDTLDNIGRRRVGQILKNARMAGTSRYVRVRLCRDGVIQEKTVHHAVLEAFRGPRPEGCDGCHKDGNRRNNALSNLRWDTRSANQLDKLVHGTMANGSRNGWAKVSEEQAEFAIAAYKCGVPSSVIGRVIGVNRNHAMHIATGRMWSQVKAVAPSQEMSEVLGSLAAVSRRLHRLGIALPQVKRADKRRYLTRERDELVEREKHLIALAWQLKQKLTRATA